VLRNCVKCLPVLKFKLLGWQTGYVGHYPNHKNCLRTMVTRCFSYTGLVISF
jgi:hypothetical protein